MEKFALLPLSVVGIAVLVACGIDLWKFRIHNKLTIPLILSGLIYHVAIGHVAGFSFGVLGVLVGTLPFALLYARGAMGAGDLKLMAGVGAWMGPWFTIHVLIVSGLATGLYSVGLMVLKHATAQSRYHFVHCSLPLQQESPEAHADLSVILSRADRRWKAIPFGAMVALGVFVTMIWIG